MKLYVLTIPVFLAIDMIWLVWAARSFYRDNLGHLLSETVNWPSAILFYLVFILGILIFAVIPALKSGSLAKALLWGGLFGFFTYATYDLTNMATLRDWPVKVAAADILWWGLFLVAAASPGGWRTIISPLTINFLLLYVSGIPLLEKKYEGRPEFERYKARTNALIPWFPRKTT